MNSLISIITPTYNSSLYVEETILSVIDQSYSNWELILVDDCSSDETLSILKKYTRLDNRIRYYSNNENKGAAYTRNRGLKNAQGRYIAFIDSDDTWAHNKLELQLSVMKKENLCFTHTAYNVVNEFGDCIKSSSVKTKCYYQDILKCNYVFCSTVILDTHRFNKIEFPTIRRRQDWGLWLKILRNTDEIAFGINEPLCNYRISKNSLSSNKVKLIKYNYYIYRDVLSYSSLKSIFLFFRFFVFHFLKKRYY